MTADAAPDLRTRIRQDLWPYFQQNLLAQVVLLLGGLIVARVLGPTDYGLWNGLQLFTMYAPYAFLGLLVAANREIPIHRGRQDEAAVSNIRNATFGTTVILSGGLGIGVVAAALWARPRLDSNVFAGMLCMGVIVAFQQVVNFFEMLFRSHHDFRHAGALRLYRPVTEMALAALLVMASGFVGRLLAAMLSGMTLMVYAFARNRVPLRLTWNPRETARLIRLGMPIMAVDVLLGILMSLDRIMILGFLDRTALGYYSLGLMMISILWVLPRVVWEILYPRFGERFGQTGQPAALERLVVLPLMSMAVVMALMLGAVVLLLPLAVTVILPGYLKGLEAARIYVLGSFFLALVGGPGNFIHTISSRQIPLLVIFGIGAALALLATWMTLSLGYGIIGVASAMMGVNCLATTALILYVLRCFSGWRQSLQRLVSIYLPFVLVVAFCLMVEQLAPTPQALTLRSLWVVGIKLLAYAGLAGGVLYLSQRWGIFSDLLSLIREVRLQTGPGSPVFLKADHTPGV